MTSQARLIVIASLALIFPLSRVVGYSVDTVSWFPRIAACNVCQASMAHLTRTGNSETPEKTASLPSSARFPFAGDSQVMEAVGEGKGFRLGREGQ